MRPTVIASALATTTLLAGVRGIVQAGDQPYHLGGAGDDHRAPAGRTVPPTAAATALSTAPATTASTAPAVAAVPGRVLSGSFLIIPGSAGAGHIEARVVLTNTSAAACTTFGYVGLLLLGASDTPLPTHVVRVPGSAPTITLGPGASASAVTRFSPDIPWAGRLAVGRLPTGRPGHRDHPAQRHPLRGRARPGLHRSVRSGRSTSTPW